MWEMLLVVLGLAVFEVISSIDNAVVNADVLSTFKNERARKFFVTWGIFLAVFLVRGLLPSLIVYFANPDVGLFGAFSAMWASDPSVAAAIEATAPMLLMGGGTFLALLWLHWFFVEDTALGLPLENRLTRFGAVWFHAIATLLLVGLFVAIRNWTHAEQMNLALAASIGFSAFFITDGFKQNAAKIEERLTAKGESTAISDWSKVLFLEVIDLTFSIDGVVGAFAFTMSVPLILLGNGIGALVVRQITLSNVERIQSYRYLKHGAMYSIGFLGSVMVAEAFGAHVDSWISPVVTFVVVGAALWLSIRANRRENAV